MSWLSYLTTTPEGAALMGIGIALTFPPPVALALVVGGVRGGPSRWLALGLAGVMLALWLPLVANAERMLVAVWP